MKKTLSLIIFLASLNLCFTQSDTISLSFNFSNKQLLDLVGVTEEPFFTDSILINSIYNKYKTVKIDEIQVDIDISEWSTVNIQEDEYYKSWVLIADHQLFEDEGFYAVHLINVKYNDFNRFNFFIMDHLRSLKDDRVVTLKGGVDKINSEKVYWTFGEKTYDDYAPRKKLAFFVPNDCVENGYLLLVIFFDGYGQHIFERFQHFKRIVQSYRYDDCK